MAVQCRKKKSTVSGHFLSQKVGLPSTTKLERMEYGSKKLEKVGEEASQHVISQTVQKSFGIVMALKKTICVFTAGNIYL